MIYKGTNNEYIALEKVSKNDSVVFNTTHSCPLMFIWLKNDTTRVSHLEKTVILPKDTIICVSQFQHLTFCSLENARLIKFNKEFYCVLHHDSEVSCKGILFYNSNQLPYFKITEHELEKFEMLWKMFKLEMESADQLQLEMLQMMLKRFIILATRVYKSQNNFLKLDNNSINIVREFNFLVEQHFKTKHSVKDYADLLNKSPKTLSNIFKRIANKTPLQLIHERKALEAKRLLRYTDKTIKEIAYELGFEDIQTFSRFFKKTEKISPSEFKKQPLGNIANS